MSTTFILATVCILLFAAFSVVLFLYTETRLRLGRYWCAQRSRAFAEADTVRAVRGELARAKDSNEWLSHCMELRLEALNTATRALVGKQRECDALANQVEIWKRIADQRRGQLEKLAKKEAH